MSGEPIEVGGGDTAMPRNLRKRLDVLARHAPDVAGRRVVDCGCGRGEYVRALHAAGARDFGVSQVVLAGKPG